MKLLKLAFMACAPLYAQVGIGTTTPHNEAILELNASDKGFLLSQVALSATNLATPLAVHTAGFVAYNTATAGSAPTAVTPGMYYNTGSSWVRMTTKLPALGDIKNGFQATDHNGWYLLNGRAVTSLSTVARTNAVALGYATVLADAQDRFLKSRTGAEAVNAIAGANSFVIAQTNLPNVSFSGTTSSDGAHTHTYVDNNATASNYLSGTDNPLADSTGSNLQTGSSGAHTHTYSFSTGGTSSPVEFIPSYLVANVFVYLGE